jgi:hypothetical protein
MLETFRVLLVMVTFAARWILDAATIESGSAACADITLVRT